MAQTTLTTGTLWTVPGLASGDHVTVETWGGGSGGSGTGATNGGGGAGGAYASSDYVLTPNDITNGVAYAIGAAGVGNTGVGGVGGNTSFSTNSVNMLPNTIYNGCVTGVVGSGGALPTPSSFANGAGLTNTIVNKGTDALGFPYFDLRINGTPSDTSIAMYFSGLTITPLTYTISAYLTLAAGSLTNITGIYLLYDTFTAGAAYLSTLGIFSLALTTTETRFTSTDTAGATTASATPYLFISYTTATPIDMTIRVSAMQFEQSGAVTFWKSTPGYALANGGAAPIGTAGGVGSATASIGTIATFAGGSGRAYNAAGSPGGGAAGKDGAGVSATTTTSGAGDNSSGGAGVVVKTTAPGNVGTANAEGGSGGGALITAAGVAGAGGAPGGGGGGSDAGSGTRTGGAGGLGQIRLTYTLPSIFPPWPKLASADMIQLRM